jgi:hypothetical protein
LLLFKLAVKKYLLIVFCIGGSEIKSLICFFILTWQVFLRGLKSFAL